MVSVDESLRLDVADEAVVWFVSLFSFSTVLSFLGWLFVFVIWFNELYKRVLFSDADDGGDA